MRFHVGALAGALPALLLLGSVNSARAQSLADVAKQEEERRKTIKEPSKVYSNKDLHSVPPVISGPTPDAATAGDEGSATSQSASEKGSEKPSEKGSDKGADKATDKGDKKDPGAGAPAKGQVKDQAYWSGRMKSLKAQLDHDQTFAEALQTRINALTTDFVNRDDPAQKALIAQNKQKALDELSRLKKAIEDDKKAISDLEDEARRAGVPPGWLRS